jgi:hypothetical protein
MANPGLDRDAPIRVVLFCGRFLEPAARRFIARLDAHPEIERVGAFAQGGASGTRERFADLWRRRGLLSLPLIVLGWFGELTRRIGERSGGRSDSTGRATALDCVEVVPDIHAPEVLRRVRALAPDLGLIYGAPILKPALFEIPRLGTLGIHHGRLPDYRGRKTTFWQVFNGEPSVGVTIQLVNAGIDCGQIVVEGSISVEGKSYRRILRESQALGVELYLDAILQLKKGTARPRDPGRALGPHYRDPTLWQVLQLPLRRLAASRRHG